MAETAQALWYTGQGRTEIREEPLGPLAGGVLRIRATHGGISRGTESLVAAGRVPASEHQRMRAPFMAGSFPFPVKYGYATVGAVERGPSALLGRNVFALYPHQTVFDLPAEAAVVVPDAVPPSRAVLAANMETALNAAWDAGPGPFGRAAVVGAGVIGILTGYLCRKLLSADVTLVDVNPAREATAAALGLRFALPGAAPTECDLVFHASASSAGLVTALAAAAEEASIIELSWYGDALVSLPLGGAFHSRRLKLMASQVGKVAPSHRREWTHHRRLQHAVGLLDDDRLDVLLEPAIAFEDLPQRLPSVLAPGSAALCQCIDYRQPEEGARVRRGSP
ncbi:MAG: zinc-binding alcohol dehydrogenase [Alphaproteobacteria bacterium]|nr:zinc-binding alcohol dehydrogenase [Alphaproteobacteria bacterium]